LRTFSVVRISVINVLLGKKKSKSKKNRNTLKNLNLNVDLTVGNVGPKGSSGGGKLVFNF
jgi:hypothetical protein